MPPLPLGCRVVAGVGVCCQRAPARFPLGPPSSSSGLCCFLQGCALTPSANPGLCRGFFSSRCAEKMAASALPILCRHRPSAAALLQQMAAGCCGSFGSWRAPARFPLDRGRDGPYGPPLPPNRTGGFPAYGSPVIGFLCWGGHRQHGLVSVRRVHVDRSRHWARCGGRRRVPIVRVHGGERGCCAGVCAASDPVPCGC